MIVVTMYVLYEEIFIAIWGFALFVKQKIEKRI
jgi:hypothetical protein